MRWISAVVLFVVCASPSVLAQPSSWNADVAVVGFAEVWDLNGSREQLHGALAGLDHPIWRGLAVRVEAVRVLVAQQGADTWLTGGWFGLRARGRGERWRPFGEIGAGRGFADERVPPGGTRWNYMLIAGGGVEVPLQGPTLLLGIRWLHISNNGSEGRSRNPDIQSLGGLFGFAW